jgi:hypothetical protein
MERAKNRSMLTDSDWSKIFEELMKRDLIDLPLEYTQEKQLFKDDQVERIFQEKEEESMIDINRL